MDINKAINEHFERAFKNGSKKKFVPTIADQTQVLRVPCAECNTLGWVSASYVPKGSYVASAGRKPCPECGGVGFYEHHFPSSVVTLAKALAHQDELTIARSLCGIMMGMEISE